MELNGVSVYTSSAQGYSRSISDGEMELTGLANMQQHPEDGMGEGDRDGKPSM